MLWNRSKKSYIVAKLSFYFVTWINFLYIFDNIGIGGKDFKISGLDDLGQGHVVNTNLVNNVDGITGLNGRDSFTILLAKKLNKQKV